MPFRAHATAARLRARVASVLLTAALLASVGAITAVLRPAPGPAARAAQGTAEAAEPPGAAAGLSGRADRDQRRDGRRIVRATFDSAPLGALSGTELARLFGQQRMESSGLSRTRAVRDSSGDGRVLRVDFPAGAAGGAQWEVDLPGVYDRACLSYRVRFSPGFKFDKGGKLPGLAGVAEGYSTNYAAGGDSYEETPSDRGPNGKNAWSARMMWRDDGGAVTYLYAPDWNADHEYGEDKDWERRFDDGRFHTVETCITMNTPGDHDGAIATRFDGERAYRHDSMRFRDTDDLGINLLFFSTFRGGNDSSWYSDQGGHIEFDDFSVTVADTVP